MPISANATHDEALTFTTSLLDDLRNALDRIRAETERDELASVIQNTKAHLSALREELEDTIAHRGGQTLARLAEELEHVYGVVDDEEVFTISELREMAKASPRALDSSYRSVHQAWGTHASSDQFAQYLASTGTATSFEWQVKQTLLAYFDEARAR